MHAGLRFKALSAPLRRRNPRSPPCACANAAAVLRTGAALGVAARRVTTAIITRDGTERNGSSICLCFLFVFFLKKDTTEMRPRSTWLFAGQTSRWILFAYLMFSCEAFMLKIAPGSWILFVSVCNLCKEYKTFSFPLRAFLCGSYEASAHARCACEASAVVVCLLHMHTYICRVKSWCLRKIRL